MAGTQAKKSSLPMPHPMLRCSSSCRISSAKKMRKFAVQPSYQPITSKWHEFARIPRGLQSCCTWLRVLCRSYEQHFKRIHPSGNRMVSHRSGRATFSKHSHDDSTPCAPAEAPSVYQPPESSWICQYTLPLCAMLHSESRH